MERGERTPIQEDLLGIKRALREDPTMSDEQGFIDLAQKMRQRGMRVTYFPLPKPPGDGGDDPGPRAA